MKANIYTQEGKAKGEVELAESVFAAPWNSDLVHQVVVSMQSNARAIIAHTKNRGDVRGGGKKPWNQKGSGRARHGSSRSPIWKGGGVTFGPRNEKDYTKKINKKMRAKALFSVISKKIVDKEMLFVDSIKFDTPKTAQAKDVILALSKIKDFETMESKKHNSVLIALSEKNVNTQKSFSNFSNVKVCEVRNINPVDVLRYKYIIITDPDTASKQLEARLK